MASAPPSGARRRRRRSTRSGAPAAAPRSGGRIDWFEVVPFAILLGLALLIGGAADPLSDMAIRIVALVVILVLVARLAPADWRRLRPAWIVALVVLAIAAIELVPLPYATWRGLPGHAAFADLLDALQLGGTARPLSLDPEATRATLIAVVPGLAAFAAALVAGQRTLGLWRLIVVAGAVAVALIGGLQVAGYRNFYFYQHSNFGQLTGMFANRNHASDLLLIGIALLAARLDATSRRAREIRTALVALIGLLAVAVLLTSSRFGIALLGVEMIALAILLAPPRRRVMAGVLVAILGVVAVLALVVIDKRIGGSLGRFGSLAADLRPEIWNSTIYATGQFWPFGSGLGTFVPVYSTVEQLDTMPAQIVNHAHNEYLELTLELGMLGPILILAYLAALVAAIVRAERRGAELGYRVAVFGIVVLLAHSTNEFPLRNAALMVVFGLLNGIAFAAPQQKMHGRRDRSVSE